LDRVKEKGSRKESGRKRGRKGSNKSQESRRKPLNPYA
jgi:hypothetical protein